MEISVVRVGVPSFEWVEAFLKTHFPEGAPKARVWGSIRLGESPVWRPGVRAPGTGAGVSKTQREGKHQNEAITA
jgi:hypothetical protein